VIIIGDPAQLTHITQVAPEWKADACAPPGCWRRGLAVHFSANSLFHFAAAAAGDHHLFPRSLPLSR